MDWELEEREVRRIENRVNSAQETVAKEKRLLGEAESVLRRTLVAQEILQHIAQAVQEQVHKRICKVVSVCLESVFGETAYEFNIIFERKRGKTEACLQFIRDGMVYDPLSASGGGVVDVACFALRVACLVLHRPRLSKVVILDEPFKFVSAQYRDNVRSMLEQLAEDMDIQIVMVTHLEELSIGKVIDI